MSKNLEIIRFSPPTKLDTFPFGTRCIVINGQQKDVYIQYSTNELDPVWEVTGTITVEIKSPSTDAKGEN